MRRIFLSLIGPLFFISNSISQVTFNGGGDGTSWEDPANWDSGSVPLITDDVVINGTSSVTVSSNNAICSNLLINTDASIMVTSTGRLSVGPGTTGLDMRDDALITVNGTLNVIDATTSDCIDMDQRSKIVNNGIVMIEMPQTEGINMDDDAIFDNNLGAELRIKMVDGSDGICMDDSDSEFNNFGTIVIDHVDGTGEGIEVDDGTFTNEETGSITILRVTGDIVSVESGGEFINKGNMSLRGNPTNTSSSLFQIEENGSFTNEGYLRLNSFNNVASNALDLQGAGSVLNNSMCGVIEIVSENFINVASGSIINNDGVLSTATTSTHSNNGTINNNAGAYILSPNGFMVSPNAVVNNGNIDPLCAVPTPRVVSLCEGGPCAVAIPTLSQWMVIILGMIFMILGIIAIKERNQILSVIKI